MMRTKEAGLNLIKRFESFRAYPYICPSGIPSIGYGTTYYPNGKKVTMKDKPITEEEAYKMLYHEVDEKEEILHRYLTKIGFNYNENQFAALMSFAYNLGLGPIVEGGRSLNEALKSGMLWKIADAILLYNKGTKTTLGVSRKVVMPGLVARREAERELFLKKVG